MNLYYVLVITCTPFILAHLIYLRYDKGKEQDPQIGEYWDNIIEGIGKEEEN